MNVAFVSPGYRPARGGVETHVEQIATRIAAAGHRATVLTHAVGGGSPRAETIDGVRVERMRSLVPGEHLGLAPAIGRRVRDGGFDVVHAHNYHATPALLATSGRAPLVFTPHFHGTSESRLRRGLHVLYRPLGARVFARARRVICVSEAEARLVRSSFPAVAERISVIPNGVHVEELRAAAPYELSGTQVAVVGRLERYKQVGRVIEAMPLLGDDHELRIVGEGGERSGLEALAQRLGISKRVHFLGSVATSELRRWMRTADVLVSMSEIEAMGITVLEALAADTPVVASRIPAHEESAGRAPAAVTLVPVAATPEQVADAIRATAGRRVGDLAIPGWDQVAEDILAILQKACQGGGTG